MIVTVTLNPALDKSTEVERLMPEKKMRCTSMKTEAGGGGINISKAIKELGGKSISLFTSGGANGRMLEQILTASAMQFQAIPIAGETRESFVANEISTNKQYRFIMPGPEISGHEIETFMAKIKTFCTPGSFLVFSGSLPPGAAAGVLSRMAAIAKANNTKFIADTSGEPLKQVVNEGAYLIKPNLTELCSLVEKDYLQADEIGEAATSVLQKSNCGAVVVSMGPSGALLVTKDFQKRIIAAGVKKINTVGAGDSMVGGIVWMLEQGKTLEDAVRFGVACGTAATINKGTALFSRGDALRFYEWMKTE